MQRTAIVLVAGLALSASLLRAQGPAADWWAHVVVLADDSMKGRSAGSPEHRRAADYVAAQFRAAGLSPAAGGYLQTVPLEVISVDQARSAVVVRGPRESTLDLATQLAVNPRGHCGAVEAPLVFLGYGIHAPEVGHDDLEGQDLRGKVAVFFAGAPPALTAAVVAHRQGAGERWRLLHARGAVGVLTIYNPSTPGADWERTITTAQQPAYALASEEEFAARRFAGTVHHDAARPLFAGSGHDLDTLLAAVRAGAVLPRFALTTSLRARLRCSARPLPSENVVALLPGRDPALAREYIVLTAHLDHVGEFGETADRIYNGAMDNASGVAALIDLAHRLRAAGITPRRTLVFAAVTAEERNLLGSYQLARRPPFAAGTRVVANVNLDMFLPIIPMRSLIAFGMEESSLQRDVEAAAAAVGIVAERDPIPGQNIFIRSDQYNFVRAGVPAVMLLTGANGDAAIWKTWEQWMAERYHRPGDDLRQPVNFESAETFQRAVLALVRRIGDADAAPAWNPASVFRPSRAAAVRTR